MEQRLKACLVLGCNGFVGADGFKSCLKIENVIMDLAQLNDLQYIAILDFLENACDLFTMPMYDYNKCVNSLSLLYKNYDAFNQSMLFNIQAFLKMHRQCGVWLMLVLKEDLNG